MNSNSIARPSGSSRGGGFNNPSTGNALPGGPSASGQKPDLSWVPWLGGPPGSGGNNNLSALPSRGPSASGWNNNLIAQPGRQSASGRQSNINALPATRPSASGRQSTLNAPSGRLSASGSNNALLAQSGGGGRYNESALASFDRHAVDNPFGEGTFRWVAKGVYTAGPRCGQPCVGKWFKTGETLEDEYFALDLKAVDKAHEIVRSFNDLGILDKPVKINIPKVWRWREAGWRAGMTILVEPFIEGYQKFNSNSGWFDDSTPWGRAMQALSHFSYHVSGGLYVLCDLQGGIYQREVVLTDPVILSWGREYGVTDGGAEGIRTFFHQHRCNEYCRSSWKRPSSTSQVFSSVAQTRMVQRVVPTDLSRKQGTR